MTTETASTKTQSKTKARGSNVKNNLTVPQPIVRNSHANRCIKRTFEDRWSKIDLKDLARQHTHAALETLVEVMSDIDAPPSARLTAANSLLDRGWGKPTTHSEVTVDVYDRMSDSELIAFISEALPTLPRTIDHDYEPHNIDDNDYGDDE